MKSSAMVLFFLFGGAFFGASNSVAQSASAAQSAPPLPVIFFTDLTSGPNSGGENNNGTILTIYGRNFGATQGTSKVTVGGGAVAAYNLWGGRNKAASAAAQLETISVAIGAAAASGTVVVTTPAGTSVCENAQENCQFTVRTGNIYCVATTGSDSNTGLFPSSCFRTVVKAKNTMVSGDIVYILNGVTSTTQDNFGATLLIGSTNSAASPKAFVAYPGAVVTFSNSAVTYGIRFTGASYIVLSQLVMSGTGGEALELSPSNDNIRVVGSDFSCPNAGGQAACAHFDTSTNIRFYGNYVHNVGDQHGSIDKFYHGVYFTTNSNHIWVGWNEVNNNPGGSTTQGGCRAVQFYSTGGANQFDLHVFNNYIHNAICDGINFATVNPTAGTVEAYNNIIFHVGTGPDPGNGSSNYSCVLVGGGTGGNVLVYNNTLYDCGSRLTNDAGALDPTNPGMIATNNIIYQLPGESYVNVNANISLLSGSNNIWFGLGNSPTQTTGNVNSDPLLVNPTTDFHLRGGSLAIDAGATLSLSFDFEGTKRPQGAGYDIGAYEYFAGTTVQRPNPPTNLTVVVH